MVTPGDELVQWFEAGAIAYGYAHDTGRAKIADEFLGDLNKIATQAMSLDSLTQRRLVSQMTEGKSPWVRYCAAMLFMKHDKPQAIQALKKLSTDQGMFVPMCIALLEDLSTLRE